MSKGIHTPLCDLFHTAIPPILHALRNNNGPMCAVEISKATGYDHSFIQRTLKADKMKELVKRLPDKRWELTETGTDVSTILDIADILLGKIL